VVPPGDETAWTLGAFSGEVRDGFLYGRGAVDMKGGIACSVAAVLQYLADTGGKPKGSISFLITGDEEDVSVNGTIKLLKWCAERGEKFDHCVLGEPSNVETLGDCIKIGPPRLAVGHALCRRRAGPCCLSAPGVEPGAGYFAADRGALRRAA
jgi:succinyl-diaminopimelate desuccinylase